MTEEETLKPTAFGFIGAPSSSTEIRVSSWTGKNQTPIVGQMVYFDQPLDDARVYRALGTVTDVTTENAVFGDPIVLAASARRQQHSLQGTDLKNMTIKIQAVYSSLDAGVTWEQAGGGLLTSPDTLLPIFPMTEETVGNMLSTRADEVVNLGTFRGLSGVPVPMVIPGFSGRRGASHSAIVGRSGVGKTGLGHTVFFTQMKNESHAILVVDPQGQWANESGFLFSLQGAARSLGREVTVLRVSEDIRLPLRKNLLSQLMEEMKLWGSLQRMGDENRQIFSDEVARRIVSALNEDSTLTPRATLTEAFRSITRSQSTLGRIYARGGDAIENLRRILCLLADEPFINSKGEQEEPSDEDQNDAEEMWSTLLPQFTPLINLFARENLAGKPRRALHGPHGFLSSILRARSESEVAPYVVLDMSSDVSLNARADYAQATSTQNSDTFLAEMRQILDNQEVKAHIVSTILSEVKAQAENAFAEGHGNLDTQIVFDEAWRYAPRPSNVSSKSAIYALTEKLAGFALDTRKYGIGWTYILQSPSDLNETIWKQLSYIYSGYGMVGSDKKMLSEMMDDKEQMRLYDQFASPSSTGVYPFMVTGPVNPLIFTAAPTFFNVFTDVSQLLEANATWIDAICDRRGLPRFSKNPNAIKVGKKVSEPKIVASKRVTGKVESVVGSPTVNLGSVEKAPF